jgi:hypothetical protein
LDVSPAAASYLERTGAFVLGYGHVFSAAPEPEGIVCGSQLQRVTPGFEGFIILDFGVARMRDQRTTRDGKILTDRHFERLSDSISFRRFQA